VVDTDDAIALDVGVPAAQFLRENGETAFRERELEALREHSPVTRWWRRARVW
jgi:shikimate kinase